VDGVGPPEQQPAIPEPSRVQSAHQLLLDARPSDFKTGYEYQAINTEIDDFNPKYGRDTYGGQFSRPSGAAADPATYNLADFMFGARNSYALINPFVANLRQRMHFAYLQDDYKATERLTLNLGLRYDTQRRSGRRIIS
jgi:outer membrane receptor protein involved in Fe transport